MTTEAAALLAPYRDRLGTVPDAVIAKETGIPRERVRDFRREAGIPAYSGQPLAAARSGGLAASDDAALDALLDELLASDPEPPHRLEAFRDQLGRVSDEVIAQRAGVERTTVGGYRRKLGIRAFTRRRGKAEARRTPARKVRPVAAPEGARPMPSAEPARARTAFRVVAVAQGEERRFVVVGEDISDAATTALRALTDRPEGPWSIHAVEMLHEVIA